MATEKSSNTERIDRPEPGDLQAYLPWACGQLQLPKEIVITKNLQAEYVSAVATGKTKGKSKPRLPSLHDVADTDKADASDSQQQEEGDVIRISAVYDFSDNLVGLKFDKNSSIPRMLMQIVGLIIKFQIYLTNLTINQGMNKYVLYEINDFLPKSRITDICLDNCYLCEAAYHILLENKSCLRNLSLSRCKINDAVVALIFAELWHPKPGSNMIILLNLSSNRITDVGAKSIADALKMNTKLTYLNLADNLLTDEGAASIFYVLLEFPLTDDEVQGSKCRHMEYLRKKKVAIELLAKELRITDAPKMRRTLPSLPRSPKLKGKDKDESLISEKSTVNTEAFFYDRAKVQTENTFGPFKDPYGAENTIFRDGMRYCLGNNILALLNLSYNNLCFSSVQKLLEVVTYQRDQDRKPRGLLNCKIEGNLLPVACKELLQIEEILETALSGPSKRGATHSKKKVK